MALVIASQLRKELSGWQLFDGVSFKVERRDRIALSGPNGAGTTTLLRILNGETDYQDGALACTKATLDRYAEAQARLEHAGGYGWRDRAVWVVRGLGFAEPDLDRPLETFSGG